MTSSTDPGGRRPEEIEREIADERGRLASTTDELQDRLSVGSLIDEAMGRTRADGGEFARGFGRAVRENPVPVALIGLGLAWLMAGGQGAGRRRDEVRAHGELYDDEWAPVDEGGYGTMSAYGGPRTRHLDTGRAGPGGIPRGGVDWDEDASSGDRPGASVRSATGAARGYGRDAGDAMGRMLEDQPLVAGALALAVGAAIGGLLPNTRAEDRTMGERAERLRGDAADAAAEEGAKARRVADAAAGEARRMADDAIGRGGTGGRAAVERAGERTREAAERVSDAASDEARRQDLGGKLDPDRK